MIVASATVLAAPTAIASPAADDPVVDVAIDSFSPATPKPGQAVTITGRVTNTSNATIANPQAIACIDEERVTTRAEIAAIPTEQNKPVNNRNTCHGLDNPNSTTFQAYTDALAPKATVRFQLLVPWDEWHIGNKPGVYAVGVMFRGNVATVVDGDKQESRITAGRSRVLMPVIDGKPTARKVNTAVVLPLRHRPTMLGNDRFANESLAQSMAPTGPLGRLLALGQKQKVTWLVDPAMLDEARQMRDGYRVVGDNNISSPGTGAKAVASWLRAFDATRAKNPVVLLPYGDPDAAGLIEGGNGLRDLVSQSRAATEQYNLGGAQGFSSGLWLENASVTSRNLAAASTGYAGARSDDTTLVSSSSWPADDRPSLSPSPVYNVLTPEGPVKSVRTVIADSALTAGGPDPEDASSPLQVRQRFAAETELLASTGKGPISVVAIPPRGWDQDGQATAQLLQGLTLPWITPVTLNDITAPKPVVTKAPAATRPASGLTGPQLDQIRQLSNSTNTFISLLNNVEQADENLRRALLRAGSYGWRGFTDEAQRFIGYEQGGVSSQLNKVHLVTNAGGERGQHRAIKVNLSGSKGQFPLTVENGLDVTIRISVAVSSPNRDDLRIQPIQQKIVPPHQKATFQIKASAEQNGLIKAEAEVISFQQVPVGKSQELVIQAAQYGSVGWILVGAACALLFGTSAVRIYRRIRSEKRNPTPAEPGSDPLHPAPLDSEEPAEPVTDSVEPPTDELQPRLTVTPEPNGHAQENLKEGVGTKDG
ncbi:hypothetical protein F1D05_20470 [Kribbella qitaiheensis]|uniref:Uncharacterized protein n=2 Tax=Kribbella qitaiheensis TaxID=1544730 RepID=A0A7G6X9X9_9ACTN|nr:hypothetical protein F1D05_20470 [Kribbella qitaiheensis]